MSSAESVTEKVVRKSFTDRQRQLIADESGNLCDSCHMTLETTFQIDHIVPLQAGGSNDPSNLHALCPNCHARKSSTEKNIIKIILSFPPSYRFCWHCGITYSSYFTHHCSEDPWYRYQELRKDLFE